MYPAGERDEYVVTDYIHPTDWRNRRVLGLTSSAKRPAAKPSSARVTAATRCSQVRCGSSRNRAERTIWRAALSAVRAIRSCNHGRTSAGSCRHAAWGLPPDRPDGGHPGFAQPDAAATAVRCRQSRFPTTGRPSAGQRRCQVPAHPQHLYVRPQLAAAGGEHAGIRGGAA